MLFRSLSISLTGCRVEPALWLGARSGTHPVARALSPARSARQWQSKRRLTRPERGSAPRLRHTSVARILPVQAGRSRSAGTVGRPRGAGVHRAVLDPRSRRRAALRAASIMWCTSKISSVAAESLARAARCRRRQYAPSTLRYRSPPSGRSTTCCSNAPSGTRPRRHRGGSRRRRWPSSQRSRRSRPPRTGSRRRVPALTHVGLPLATTMW